MSSEIAISVTGLTKCYRIYNRPQDRLKQSILNATSRMLPGTMRKRFAERARACGREFSALREIDFTVNRGETVGIIGRNGSGKSTLLQLICGTLQPTSGQIHVVGRIAALLELGAGFNPEFTGRENVFLNGQLLGLSRTQILERFDAIASFADIGDFLDQPVKTYSSGMYVRLAFAVIAHVDADILVIDEALAVGDAYFTQKCMRFLHRFMQTGTVLFVSHDMASVKALAHRSIWLEHGTLRMSGPTKTIADIYLQALYGESQEISPPNAPEAIESNAGSDDSLDLPAEDFRLLELAEKGISNTIRIGRFDSNASGFGDSKATISQVRLFNKQGTQLIGVCGGEMVTLEIVICVHATISHPIVGFFLRNRLGQNVFGDNSYIASESTPLVCDQESRLVCKFEFVMPFLPRGDYALSVAVASGTNLEHTQHQWLHDALVIKSLSSDVHADVIGIPMNKISLSIVQNSDSS